MTRMELGVNISFAKKRWPEPEAWLEIVRERLGLSYVEFDSDFLDPMYISEPAKSQLASEIRQLAKKYKITVHSYSTGTMTHCVNLISHPDERVRKNGIRWAEEAIGLATKIGAKGIGGHFDTISYRDWNDPERYNLLINNLISSLQYLSKIAKQEGQEFILWEQMYTPSEVPYTIEQAEALIGRANKGASVPIYLTIDVGHSCCHDYPHRPKDANPYEWLITLAPLSPVIHLQQTNKTESCHWPFTREYNRIGIIRGEKVVEAIKASGAEEILFILEIFPPLSRNEEQVLDAMKESVEYWKKYIES